MTAFNAATNPYGALVLTVQVMGAGATETQLAAGTVVVAVIDEFNRGRSYNPVAIGLPVQSGDAANKWLPTVGAVTANTETGGAVGSYTITFTPGSSDTVNVASVQTMRVDRGALVIVASGSF
jgi:hypothetical protein